MQTPPVEPSEKQIRAAEVAIEGLLKGIEGAAQQQPTNYLVVVAICATLFASCAIVVCFLRYLRSLDEKQDERDEKQRQHMEKMAAKFADDGRASQRECHLHSVEMMDKRTADSECLKEVSHDLKEAVGDLKDMTKDTKQFVQTALTKLEARGMGS